jgi:hypothetical protein
LKTAAKANNGASAVMEVGSHWRKEHPTPENQKETYHQPGCTAI